MASTRKKQRKGSGVLSTIGIVFKSIILVILLCGLVVGGYVLYKSISYINGEPFDLDKYKADQVQTSIIYRKETESSEYTEYMREQVREHGFLAGLTALLQCSWLYAYIGEKMTAECSEEIAASPFRFWFDAYTCKEYIEANQMWIDTLDRETEGITGDTAVLLKNIFRTCAEYENKLWDDLSF